MINGIDNNIFNLTKQRKLLMGYVYMKLEINDLHGAIDALMDMREIDAMIKCIKESK